MRIFMFKEVREKIALGNVSGLTSLEIHDFTRRLLS